MEDAEHAAAVMLSALEAKLRDEMDDQVRVAVSSAASALSRRLLLRMRTAVLAPDALTTPGVAATSLEATEKAMSAQDSQSVVANTQLVGPAGAVGGRMAEEWWQHVDVNDPTGTAVEQGVDALVAELHRLRAEAAHCARTAAVAEQHAQRAVAAKHAREVRAADKRAKAAILQALTCADPATDGVIRGACTGTVLQRRLFCC